MGLWDDSGISWTVCKQSGREESKPKRWRMKGGRERKGGRRSPLLFCNLSTGAGFVTQTNSVKELKEKALTTVTGWHRSTSCTIALLVEGALL